MKTKSCEYCGCGYEKSGTCQHCGAPIKGEEIYPWLYVEDSSNINSNNSTHTIISSLKVILDV